MIYGWGKQTKKLLGDAATCTCGQTPQYLKITTWFTLMFIPMIPYKREYYVQCSACGKTYSITKVDYKNAMNNTFGQ